MGTLEENKELIRHQVELYNKHDIDAANEIYGRDFLAPYFTWEQNKEIDIMMVKSFPDFKITIVDMIAEGDKVALINNVTGTHTGETFMGIPATGNKIDCTNTRILTIADNKIVKFRGTSDSNGLWQPLGVMPTWEEAMQAYKETHNLK